MPERNTVIARWDALTYDGSAPGREIPSLHIYLRPAERSGETPGTARRLFQDLVSRFYSGPPFLEPREKLRDTVAYALDESSRHGSAGALEKIHAAVAILDRAEGELHLYRKGPMRLHPPPGTDRPAKGNGFETVRLGRGGSIALLDGAFEDNFPGGGPAEAEHGRVIVAGSTAGISIRLDDPWEEGESPVPGGEETVEILGRAVLGETKDDPGAPAHRPAAVEPEAPEERRRPRQMRNPLLVAAILLFAASALFFRYRVNQRDRTASMPEESLRAEPSVPVDEPSAPALTQGAKAPVAPPAIPAGERLWSFTAGGAVTSSPVIFDGTVAVGCRDGMVYAFTLSGEPLWKAPGPGGVGSSPAVAGTLLFFGEYGGAVVAVDRNTGEEMWRFPTGGKIVSSPAVRGGVVFIGSYDKNLHAVDAATGDEIWSYRTGDAIWSSPAVTGDVVVIGSLDRHVYGLRRSDGSLLWRLRTGGPLYASPAIAGDDLFIGSRGGTVYRLRAATGEQVWSADVGRPVHSTAAIAEDRIVIGTEDGTVLCLSKATGEILWSYPTGERVPSSPVVRDGVAYVASYDRYLYALDIESGHPLWRSDLGGAVYSSPAIAGNALFVGTNQGRFLALSLGDSESP